MLIPTLNNAIELPSGVYNVVSELKYSSPALTWYLWQLDDSGGNQTTLGLIAEQYVTTTREPCQSMPSEPQIDHQGIGLPLVHQGEAMATLALPDKHDFWLAKYRHYASDAVHVIFTRDKHAVNRLVAEPISPGLVRVYE
ncbi:MAG: hypothetical protein ABFE08_10080 [Armatimonadia bacterium]